MLYTKNKNLTDTSTQTIVTVPDGYVAYWNLVFVANLATTLLTPLLYLWTNLVQLLMSISTTELT
jgi:hypothetical protein